MKKILVTDLEYRKAQAVFENEKRFECICAPAEEKALAQMVRDTGAFAVIAGVEKYTRELYEALPAGALIARFGVGHNSIDKALAAEKGIFCTNTPGALDDSVAESAIGMMLMAARNYFPAAANLKNGIWLGSCGMELAGKTLVVCGCGNVGCRVAEIARNGFRMNVVGCDPFPAKKPEFFDKICQTPEEAFPLADILTLHLPETAETWNFINEKRLALLKNSAVIINTARGGVLDENALFDALKNGTVAGAALDVFKSEPYTPQESGKDLRLLDNALLLPHLGSSTFEACERMALGALKNAALAAEKRYGEMDLLYPAPEFEK